MLGFVFFFVETARFPFLMRVAPTRNFHVFYNRIVYSCDRRLPLSLFPGCNAASLSATRSFLSKPIHSFNRPVAPPRTTVTAGINMGEPSKSASTRFGFDVTRHNFEEALPGVVESIEEAQFVAIDTELTGLSSASNFEDMTDEPRERYIKLRKYATDFGILQYGVACFRWDEASKKYLVKPYNFYLSAATHRDTGIERRFMAQASSIEFLAEYKFNFNKAFHDGKIWRMTLDKAIFNSISP